MALASANRVAISDVEWRWPGIQNQIELKSIIEATSTIALKQHLGMRGPIELGELKPVENSPFSPKRSDLKSMRIDTQIAVEMIGTLLQRHNLSVEELADCGLFVTTSYSIGQTASDVDQILLNLSTLGECSASVRNAHLLRELYPLFGLRALTNASESFISQHYNILGENATFGDSVAASYSACRHAYSRLQEGGLKNSLVCGTNPSGIYSILTLESLFPKDVLVRESSSVVSLLMTSQISLPTFHLKLLGLAKELPKQLPPMDWCLNSSLYLENDFRDWLLKYRGCATRHFSTYPTWGSFGASSLISSLALAFSLVKMNLGQSFLICEQDLFGQNYFAWCEAAR